MEDKTSQAMEIVSIDIRRKKQTNRQLGRPICYKKKTNNSSKCLAKTSTFAAWLQKISLHPAGGKKKGSPCGINMKTFLDIVANKSSLLENRWTFDDTTHTVWRHAMFSDV